MKSTTTNRKPQPKTDRIEKAARLIESGKVTAMGEGRWHVQSDVQSTGYIVSLETGCTCHDYVETLSKQESCKHIWAAVGVTAAMLIHGIRGAQTMTELERVSSGYAADNRNIPDAFVRVARAEYAKKRDALRCDEASAILVKPQPKSNGRVGRIEI